MRTLRSATLLALVLCGCHPAPPRPEGLEIAKEAVTNLAVVNEALAGMLTMLQSMNESNMTVVPYATYAPTAGETVDVFQGSNIDVTPKMVERSTSGPPPLPRRRLMVDTTPQPTAKVTLAWDEVMDSTVIGYRIYFGGVSRSTTNASAAYTNVTDVGYVTEFTATNLYPAQTYYFAVTSYNAADLESDYSDEIAYTVPLVNPVTNVVSIACQVLQSTNDSTGPWQVFTNLPVVTYTNFPAPLYMRAVMSLNLSNVAYQVLKLDTSTLVITNNTVTNQAPTGTNAFLNRASPVWAADIERWR